MKVLASNNCNQLFAITGNECFTALWRNSDPLIIAELLSFSHIGKKTDGQKKDISREYFAGGVCRHVS